MGVLHAAIFAKGQALASLLQGLGALLWLFARFETFGGRLMRLGHGAVTRDVFLGFLVVVLRQRHASQAQAHEKKCNAFHGFVHGFNHAQGAVNLFAHQAL
jgi:hypothetical protein